jgi:hypothetical protein
MARAAASSVAVVAAALLLRSASAAPIESTAQLYDAIAAGDTGGRVGFLSDANYQLVAHVLPPQAPANATANGTTTVVLYEDQGELLAAVRSGELLAASLSGAPEDTTSLEIFSSEAIAPRALMMAPALEGCTCGDSTENGNSTASDGPSSSVQLAAAINAAIARIFAGGHFAALLQANAPFYVASAATCSVDTTLFAFPAAGDVNASDMLADVLATGVLKLAGLGPYDWGLDANYLADPPSGFWPGYTDLLITELRTGLGLSNLTLERVWADSSDGVIELVLSGEAHATEPYMTTGAFYPSEGDQRLPRQEATHMSCTTAGYEPVFITAKDSACDGPFDVNCDGVVDGLDVEAVANAQGSK